MASDKSFTRRFLCRAHLYAGLFVSPFVLLYALTGIGFNHALGPGASPETVRRGIGVTADTTRDNLPLAGDILAQLGVSGEIMFVGRGKGSLYIPVDRPGEKVNVNVDLAAGTADVTREETGAYDALLYLHKSPGPHVAAIRGNWWPTRLWRVLADSSALIILFLSASGIYLWLVLGVPQRTGLILSAAGALCFVLLIVLLA